MVEWLARSAHNPKVAGLNLGGAWSCGVSFGKTLYAEFSTPHPGAKWVPASKVLGKVIGDRLASCSEVGIMCHLFRFTPQEQG